MVATRIHIDLEEIPEIAAAARESRTSGEPIDLRMDGKTIAVLEPSSTWKPGDPRNLTPEERERFIAESGGWRGLLDTEKFLRDIAKHRDFRTVSD